MAKLVSYGNKFQMRISDELRDAIDAWRQRRASGPTRAEAIRRLIERGLEAENGGNTPDKN